MSSCVTFKHSIVNHIHWLGYQYDFRCCTHYCEFSPSTGYDSSPYGAFVDASCFTELSQFACQFYDAYSVTISHIMLLIEGRFILSRPFLSYIVFACTPLPIQLLVRAHLVHPSYSKSSSVSKYLVLVYERCINSLLLADSIPSNSDHLFWNKSMEFIKCLETWSHQSKILF